MFIPWFILVRYRPTVICGRSEKRKNRFVYLYDIVVNYSVFLHLDR